MLVRVKLVCIVMVNIVKILIVFISRILLRALYVFPLKENRIFFSSFNGRGYNCNPKCIYEYMYKYYRSDYDLIWCLNDKCILLDKLGFICVKFLTIPYFYYLITSKIIVTNLEFEATLPKRKGQLLINTWHGGGAYKVCSNDLGIKNKSRCLFMKYVQNIRSRSTDFIISSCEKQIKAYKIDFNIDENKSLNIGMPRNDIFFNIDKNVMYKLRRVICNRYLIDHRKILILFAPTQRRNNLGGVIDDKIEIDVRRICDAVKERFGGESVMLYRCHTGVSGCVHEQTIDVSDYPDMQELLLVVDILITDYSSSIWDYSFTNKPGFLFTPDLDQYKKNTNFHTPIELWPFPYAKTTEELCEEILNYDETKAMKKIQIHHSLLDSYETGNATAKVCNIIKNYIDRS